VDIILGLLKADDNSICYNNFPLTKVLSEWRSKVAYLPQQVFLIDDTLRNNIALGVRSSDIDDSKLYKAISQAKLLQLVEQLPKGTDTEIGERGVRLSGGQRQRVALARAFYHDRSVLIMDEATSALDNATEKEIVNEIRELHGKKTMIVIAHRLTTLQYCDRIYEIDKGEVVNIGTYHEIVGKK
jgi:ABC-type bacteriocin/lantibiotic exporter with double-glycine peptidase domain